MEGGAPFVLHVFLVPSLRGQILQRGEGGVAGGGRGHALHLPWGVGGGADAAQTAVQQVWRMTGEDKEEENLTSYTETTNTQRCLL